MLLLSTLFAIFMPRQPRNIAAGASGVHRKKTPSGYEIQSKPWTRCHLIGRFESIAWREGCLCQSSTSCNAVLYRTKASAVGFVRKNLCFSGNALKRGRHNVPCPFYRIKLRPIKEARLTLIPNIALLKVSCSHHRGCSVCVCGCVERISSFGLFQREPKETAHLDI